MQLLEAVVIEEASGKIAVCGGPDIFVYQPRGTKDDTLNVRLPDYHVLQEQQRKLEAQLGRLRLTRSAVDIGSSFLLDGR